MVSPTEAWAAGDHLPSDHLRMYPRRLTGVDTGVVGEQVVQVEEGGEGAAGGGGGDGG